MGDMDLVRFHPPPKNGQVDIRELLWNYGGF